MYSSSTRTPWTRCGPTPATRITREGPNKLAISAATPEDLLNSGDLTVESGGLAPLNALNELLDTFGYWFGLTTP
ncbi:hypothetical protein ACNPQM_03480 [Streptomyces sp. NPDC056231]|uniref:hypothetical protein n=1 Tax=Streptomyces sp. NPDC056231 TaxID=3345755 RepID=UPI003AAD2B4E